MNMIPAADGPPSSEIPSPSKMRRLAEWLMQTASFVWKELKEKIFLRPRTAFFAWLLVMVMAGSMQAKMTNTSGSFVFGKIFLALLCTLLSWAIFVNMRLRPFGWVAFRNPGRGHVSYDDTKLRHPVFIAWYVVSLPIAAQLYYGVFSYNRADQQRDDTARILIDGKPVLDKDTHWFLPWRHDVKIIPLDATADWYEFESMTKDGRKLFAKIKVHLRRHDDPAFWKLTSETVPSRRGGMQARLDEICSKLTAEEIDNDARVIEREIARDDGARLEELLPKEVLLDGLIEVKDVSAHPYIKKKSRLERAN